ncbi:MAG: hypothetical protein RIT27_120 [Pseudomonadota bacterium]|jgi:type IV pilus assembly protein PilY1
MKTLHTFLTSLLLVGLSGFSLPNFADDTELYAQSVPISDSTTRPNLLFILDNSGSMNTKDMVIGYDPLKNNAEIKGTRIYVLKDALYRILDEAHNLNIGLERFTFQTGAGGNNPILYPVRYVDEAVNPDVITYDVPIKDSTDDAEEGLADEPVILDDKNIEMTRRIGTEIMFAETTKTVTAKIAADADDGKEVLGDKAGNESGNNAGTMYTTTDKTIGLGSSTRRGEQIVGLRFANLGIPQDATIVASWLEFTAYDSSCNCSMKPVNIKIEAAKIADAPSFTETNSLLSNLATTGGNKGVYAPLTTASVDWDNVDVWIGEQVYQTPDLSPMIQEIITNAGRNWGDPNGVMFRLTRNPAYSSTATQNKSDANRRFYSFGESTSKAPVLKVVYTTDPAYAGKTGIAATAARSLNSFEQRISDSKNDGYEFLGNSLYRVGFPTADYMASKNAVVIDTDQSTNNKGVLKYSASSKLTLGEGMCVFDSTGSKYKALGQSLVGMRFTNLDIPQNSKIIKADVTFTSLQLPDSDGVLSSTSFPLNLNIFMQDEVNPTEFVGGAFNVDKWGLSGIVNSNITNRLPSASAPKVTWNDVPLKALGETFSTPNLSTLIEAAVAKATWDRTSNAIVFLFKPTVEAGAAVSKDVTSITAPEIANRVGSRRIYDYSDGSNGPTRAAKLKVLYGQEIKTATQKVGLRFQGVNIPRGTTVSRAYLKFTSGLAASNAANLVVKAQVGDAQPFETTARNISSRSTTSASVSWNASSANNPMTAWSYGTTYRTPDLKDMVQEVVNRSDWCGGSAMGFVISSTDDSSVRNVLSYDNDPARAPVLHVEFNPSTVPTNTCVKQVFSTAVKDAKDDGVQTVVRDNVSNDNNVFLMGAVDDKTLNMVNTKKASSSTLTKRIVGVRFQDIPIKKGATILDAKLVFTGVNTIASGENTTTTTSALNAQASLKVKGELGTAKPFEEAVANFSSRTSTTAEVSWDLPAASPWEVNKRYKTPSLKTVVQEIVNNANWEMYGNMAFFITSSDENSLRKAASFDQSPTIAPVLEITVDGLLGEGGFTQTVRTHIKSEIQLMEQAVNGLVADEAAYTPIVDALYEGALYYRSAEVSGAANDRRNKRFYRVSHKLSHNGPIEGIDEATCSPDLPDYPFSEGCKGEKIQGGFKAVYNSPITAGCQTNHIILLSDGAPTKNTVAGAIKGQGGAQGISLTCEKPPVKYYGTAANSQEYGQNQECGPELAAFLATTDNKTGLSGSIIRTHTIGLKLGSNTGSEDNSLGEKYLKAIAKAGKGSYYRADTAEDLLLAFRTIIATAMTDSATFTSPAVSVNMFNRLYHNNEIYFTFFRPSNKVSWEGNVKRYNMCTDKTNPNCRPCTAEEIRLNTCKMQILDRDNKSILDANNAIADGTFDVWSTLTDPDGAKVTMAGAGGVLPAPDSRKIYTNAVGNEAIALTDPVNALVTTNNSLTPTMFGVAADANPTAAKDDIINWVRGYDDVTTGKVRDWRFGDPLHSTPAVFTYGKDATNNKIPKTKVIVNTNEGAIRMLDGKTGVEEWMFIPKDMLAIQKDLKTNPVASQRLYGIDGKPVTWTRDLNKNGVIETGDSVWLFTGMRRGGRNIYALDVTPAADGNHRPRLVWTIFGGQSSVSQGDFSKLGQTWSTPIITDVMFNGSPKTVLLFAGGFDATTQDNSLNYQVQATMGNAIYMVDPLDGGKLLWWASSTNSSANLKLNGMNYSFPSDLTIMDTDSDGYTDRIYVGDTGGQLWRIDIPDAGAGAAVGGRLAIVGNSTTDANKRRFFYPPDVAQLSSAKYSPYAPDFDLVIIGSGHRPNPLNKTIQDRLYAFRDRQTGWLVGDTNGGKGGNAVQDTPAFLDQTVATGSAPAVTKFFTITEDKLYDATTEVLNTTADQTVLDGAKAAIQKSLGWKVDLKDVTAGFVGEKALAAPLIFSNVAYYTTFVPPQPSAQQTQSNACSASFDQGKAKSYAIDIQTGESGIYNESRDKDIGGGISGGPIVIFTENGAGVYASANGDSTDPNKSKPSIEPLGPGQALPRETVFWVEE